MKDKPTTSLVQMSRIRQELEATKNLPDVKAIRDRAQALALYAKISGENRQIQNLVAEIRIRAEMKAGRLLDQLYPHGGDRKSSAGRSTLKDFGITKYLSSVWRREGQLDDEAFEAYLAQMDYSRGELTSAGVLRLARDMAEAKARGEVGSPAHPTGRYKVLVVDPPWPMKKILRDVRPRQDEADYAKMELDEIAALPIAELAQKNAHLFLWTTQKFLQDAIDISEYWGFRYVLLMTWHKPGGPQVFDLPQYNSEFVIYARTGTPKFVTTVGFSTCFFGKRREHSRKPEEFYNTIRRVTEGPRIDYFSREEKGGFDSYGAEKDRF